MLSIRIRTKNKEAKLLMGLKYLSDVVDDIEKSKLYGEDTERIVDNARRYILTMAHDLHGYPCMMEIATRMMGERKEDELLVTDKD